MKIAKQIVFFLAVASILTAIAIALAGCGGAPTYQQVYDRATGTTQQKHDAAQEYCLNNPCSWQ